jgi:hypothetical protein
LPPHWRDFVDRLDHAERDALDAVLVGAFDAAAMLFARMIGASDSDDEVRLMTLTLIGPLTVWRMDDALLCRIMNWAELTNRELKLIERARLKAAERMLAAD